MGMVGITDFRSTLPSIRISVCVQVDELKSLLNTFLYKKNPPSLLHYSTRNNDGVNKEHDPIVVRIMYLHSKNIDNINKHHL